MVRKGGGVVMKRDSFRQFIVNVLSISMLEMLWLLAMDVLLYQQVKNFLVCISVILLAALVYIIQPLFSSLSERHPILEFTGQYIVILILFIIFKSVFGWYEGFKIGLIIAYTAPVFIASYALRLIGIRRDAQYINRKLRERKNKR